MMDSIADRPPGSESLHIETPLSDFEERYVHATVDRIVAGAPETLEWEAWVSREEGECGDYRVELEVRSPSGAFSGSGSSDELRDAVDQAEDKVRRQVDEWRSRRHAPQGPEGPALEAI